MKSALRKSGLSLLAFMMLGAIGLSWVGGAQAGFTTCVATLDSALGGNDGCQYIEPFTGSTNDSEAIVNGGGGFFGFTDWSLSGGVGGLLDVVNDNVPNSFTISGIGTTLQALVVAKDGSNTTLVGYLYNPDANGTYSLTDPYLSNPPFTSGTLSHLTLYVREPGTSVPEPASLLLLGAGLAGLGIWRRKQA